MVVWELLGIAPTTDIAKIKSAYARQAKLYHPEEHPEEFKALQKAYKAALQEAKSRKAGAEDVISEPAVSKLEPKTRYPEPKQSKDLSEHDAEDWAVGNDFTKQSEPEEPESSFDYSDIDAYGDRERFFTEFQLLAKNPYLRNNLNTWDYFLHQEAYSKLFQNTDFRMRFVRTMCRIWGWRRKTVLHIHKFLLSFHTSLKEPSNGKWETGLLGFRLKKLPRLRLPAFLMDQFWGKEGRSFHKQIHRQISSQMGRELNYDMKSDVIQYIKRYLPLAQAQTAYVDHLHKNWIVWQVIWAAAGILVCLGLVLSEKHAIEKRQEAEADLIRAEYLMELYDLESGTRSEEERLEMLRKYDSNWERAEKAIDEVLRRYENWE